MNDPLLPATLNQNGAYPPNGVIDVWQQGGGALGAAAPASDAQPLKVVHRSLRGRYPLAIVLAVAGACVGGMIGWNSKQPTYRARGIAAIEPQFQSMISINGPAMPYYKDYMTTQAADFRSSKLADRAIGDDAWQKVAGSDKSPSSQAAFLSGLRASYSGSSFNLDVTYESTDPARAIAGVNAALNAYDKIRKDISGQDVNTRTEFIDSNIKDLGSKKANAESAILETTERWRTDNLEEVMKRSSAEIDRIGSDKAVLENRLAQYEAAANVAKTNPTPPSLRDVVANDPLAADVSKKLYDAQTRLATIKQRGNLGPNSPAVIDLEFNVKILQSQLNDMVAAAGKSQTAYVYDLAGNTTAVTPQLIESTRQAIGSLDASQNRAKKEGDELYTAYRQVARQRQEVADYNTQLAAAQANLENLRVRGYTTAAPMKISPAFSAEPANDKRMTTAMVFGFGGAVLPVAALFLLGLADRRVRYSDDTSAGSKGVALLGILPNLPDRLSDPSQASVAAHCVHHIRSMLQLNAMGDEPTAITITSASSADGKTSLSLALGLSFAASGSRTLLIDTDLVGAGLSARLGVSDSTGILEALAARDPMTCVRETDVQDLSILPMGSNAVNNAGAFSPATMKRLISEAKKHFDTILIDTGPLLGSIEATPVCNASDAVILCVSRGQNRGLVERAIGHLRSINARLAGLVFNRAATADFERSISGISLRSASRSQANGHNAAYSNGDSLVGAGDRIR